MKRYVTLSLAFALAAAGAGLKTIAEGDHVLRDFKFQTGEVLPEVRIHYTTLGKPNGNNAVLILHGTGGTGRGLLARDVFANELFEPGQLLDENKYFLVAPDNIGHGKSSKPSDSLGDRFPKYGYRDMVEAQRRLLAEKFGVSHVRLIVGTSMGCMHAWVWGTEHPDEVDALMPLACQPYPITGRNLIWRKMRVDLLRQSPPDFVGAAYLSTLMSSNPQELQKRGANRADAIAEFEKLKKAVRPGDAIDQIYHFESSWDYDPTPKLERVKARVYHVNFADDPINPPELGILPREMQKVKNGKWKILPGTPDTHGHGNHTWAKFWKQYLAELLETQ